MSTELGEVQNDLRRGIKHKFDTSSIIHGMYRPFTKSYVYFNKSMNDMVYKMSRIFPAKEIENKVIYLSGIGNGGKGFSCYMVALLPDLNLQHSGGQGFPLKWFELKNDVENDAESSQSVLNLDDLYDEPVDDVKCEFVVRDGISDEGLELFSKAYAPELISKEDIFYYIYGILHSFDYRERYADNLTKELPRIPCLRKASDFWTFSKAGRALADLHIDYEKASPFPVGFEGGRVTMEMMEDKDFKVTQMKFRNKSDKSSVIYNSKITLTDIPIEAFEYEVNGKSALEWVMERQSIATHKDSGIVNDANDWAIETVQNPRYPLELFQRVITVSLETMKIVRALPKLDI